ncbi:hypothetical protein DPMN_177262 [Dreissena polymorpha]|uniref:Uncharacterized protein n=1 Tax=Dreissena polymorpha TaxID=45954 RepID=A0A9D4EA12_DREPO|nr:hypothetical protein DPMN_177262 [Dreissena polymorpha]
MHVISRVFTIPPPGDKRKGTFYELNRNIMKSNILRSVVKISTIKQENRYAQLRSCFSPYRNPSQTRSTYEAIFLTKIRQCMWPLAYIIRFFNKVHTDWGINVASIDCSKDTIDDGRLKGLDERKTITKKA